MQPTYLPIATIFGHQVRYTVPLFQRPYVWTLQEQWQPLWEDIAIVADRVLTAARDDTVRGHFLGSVVLDQTPHPTGSIQRREVIDGQQRLTTLQILLKAVSHALNEIAVLNASDMEPSRVNTADVAARQILLLTENSAYVDVSEKYKVWPTNEDRVLFTRVMDAASPEDLHGISGRMCEAYFFFLGEMRKWLAVDRPTDRATALAAAVKDNVRLIVLDLDNTDEPQAIFETLNARGTPLLPADLIKNVLLWEATNRKLDIDDLYRRYWQPFDGDHAYWRKEVGTGHAARARIDTFLQNWLTARLRENISASHLYDAFRDHFVSPKKADYDVSKLMRDIQINAAYFRQIDAAEGTSRFATFLRRLKAVDVVVMQPVLMYLLGREGITSNDLDAVAVSLESFLVRRLICGAQTRGYGALALGLLKVIAEIPDGPVEPTITGFLALQGEANRWPDDAEFLHSWTTRRFYGQIRRERVAMILGALEERLWEEAKKTEPLRFDFGQLQIEHVMPQSWEQHWPLPSDEGARERRDQLLHSIGNLTLVSGKLNAPISNAPWLPYNGSSTSKRAELKKHTKLWLNSQLVDDHETWAEDEIERRSQSLFSIAQRIWPKPP